MLRYVLLASPLTDYAMVVSLRTAERNMLPLSFPPVLPSDHVNCLRLCLQLHLVTRMGNLMADRSLVPCRGAIPVHMRLCRVNKHEMKQEITALRTS